MRLDTNERANTIRINADRDPAEVSELVDWFSVSGDLDDFIYYGEDLASNER